MQPRLDGDAGDDVRHAYGSTGARHRGRVAVARTPTPGTTIGPQLRKVAIRRARL